MRSSWSWPVWAIACLLSVVHAMRLSDQDDAELRSPPEGEKRAKAKKEQVKHVIKKALQKVIDKHKAGKEEDAKKGEKEEEAKKEDAKKDEAKQEDAKKDDEKKEDGGGSPEANGWDAAVSMLAKNGAEVSKKPQVKMLTHGGSEVRSIVAKSALEDGEILLKIPAKLWVHMDNFPEVKAVWMDCGTGYEVKLCTAMALERNRGNESLWKDYFPGLPQMDDYKAFYPRWSEKDLLDEFAGLELVESVRASQQRDDDMQKCWEDWQKGNGSSIDGVSDLKWDDIKLGLAQFRTRNHNVSNDGDGPGMGALIPAADMMNTNPSPNTAWKFVDEDGDGKKDYWQLSAKGAVEAGGELYETYCGSCDNTNMLNYWGIYMEDNAQEARQSTSCGKLLLTAQKYLEGTKPEGMVAPRCKNETLEKSQGPLRCSYARLAWESCHKTIEEAAAKFSAGKGGKEATKAKEASLLDRASRAERAGTLLSGLLLDREWCVKGAEGFKKDGVSKKEEDTRQKSKKGTEHAKEADASLLEVGEEWNSIGGHHFHGDGHGHFMGRYGVGHTHGRDSLAEELPGPEAALGDQRAAAEGSQEEAALEAKGKAAWGHGAHAVGHFQGNGHGHGNGHFQGNGHGHHGGSGGGGGGGGGGHGLDSLTEESSDAEGREAWNSIGGHHFHGDGHGHFMGRYGVGHTHGRDSLVEETSHSEGQAAWNSIGGHHFHGNGHGHFMGRYGVGHTHGSS
eukprot:TRINITY_DN35330_c0_g3_i2.p1 TRINITY_DN35330_c0_g3~~TRINITY_DN35330_c0_g3_i2.p1  ORF type:complete len:733 (-),score=242.95 TRINITY_DN35330_c0_g3_i2:77-2275(-)